MEIMQIFIGESSTGKTSEAKRITKHHETVWLDGRSEKKLFSNPFLFQEVTENTRYIVIDDLPAESINSIAETGSQ